LEEVTVIVKTQEVFYAVVGAGDLVVDKAREVGQLADRDTSARIYGDLVKRGKTLTTRITQSETTKKAVSQTKNARSQAKAAATSAGKAWRANAKAVSSAAGKASRGNAETTASSATDKSKKT
jgi:hypothetical protein